MGVSAEGEQGQAKKRQVGLAQKFRVIESVGVCAFVERYLQHFLCMVPIAQANIRKTHALT